MQFSFFVIITLISVHKTHSSSPCTSIYDFVCEEWSANVSKPESEPFWNVFREKSWLIYANLERLLQEETHLESESMFFESCVACSDSLTALKYLLRHLGGWKLEFKLMENDYNYLLHVVQVTKLFNIYPVVKFFIGYDGNLNVEKGDLVFPKIFLENFDEYSKELIAYENWILSSLNSIFGRQFDFRNSVKKLVKFEQNLAVLPSGKMQKVFVSSLSRFELQALQFLFEDFDVAHGHLQFLYMDLVFLQNLQKLLVKTHQETISNYIVWSAIKDLSRNVNEDLRRANFKVNQAIFGITKDIPRSHECIDQLLQFFNNKRLLIAYMKFFGIPQDIFVKAKQMALHIKSKFLENVSKSSWLGNESKFLAINLLANLKMEIGFPENKTDVTVKLSGNYFLDFLNLKRQQFVFQMNKLGENHQEIIWPSHIFEVNAYYNIKQDSIILPFGILTEPFFNPRAVTPEENYASLGALIGHELAHAFEKVTKLLNFDEKHHFFQAVNCFLQNYASIMSEEQFRDTKNENLADFIGLTLSYQTLESILGENFKQSLKERFFFSFAKMWCELSSFSASDDYLEENHSPVKQRVQVTLDNIPLFLETFQCIAQVNEINQCQPLW